MPVSKGYNASSSVDFTASEADSKNASDGFPILNKKIKLISKKYVSFGIELVFRLYKPGHQTIIGVLKDTGSTTVENTYECSDYLTCYVKKISPASKLELTFFDESEEIYRIMIRIPATYHYIHSNVNVTEKAAQSEIDQVPGSKEKLVEEEAENIAPIAEDPGTAVSDPTNSLTDQKDLISHSEEVVMIDLKQEVSFEEISKRAIKMLS